MRLYSKTSIQYATSFHLQGQTPLFLACREGHVPCVKHLLDCFANATLLDSLDRSPLQIAYERQHLDVVELLRSSAHGPFHYPSHYPAQPHHIAPQFSVPHPHGIVYPGGESVECETSLMQPPSLKMSTGGKPSPAMMKLKQSSHRKHNGATIAISSPGTNDYSVSHFYLPSPSLGVRHPQRHPSTSAQTSGLTTPTTDIPLRDMQATDPYLPTQRHTSPTALNNTSPPQTITYTLSTLPLQQPSSTSLGYAPKTLQPPQELLTATSATGYNPFPSWSQQQPPSDYQQTSPPSTSVLAPPPLSQPEASYAMTSSSFGDLNIASVVDSLGPSSSVAYSNPQVSKPGMAETPTTCYGVGADDRAVSLNDIEPTLLPSMDLTLEPSSVAGYIPQSSSGYMPQGVDRLAPVGYGEAVPGTTQSNGYESSGLVSSSYCQTAYNDCTQSVPSSNFQATPTYNVSQAPPSGGSTRPLQHLPVGMVDPSLQQYQNGGTGNGSSGTSTVCSPPQAANVGASRSPPSYYPSPPSVNEVTQVVAPPLSHCHADPRPPSLTPSPENREEPYQQEIMTESYVIQPLAQHPLDQTYLNYAPHHFVPYTPRSSSRLGTIV